MPVARGIGSLFPIFVNESDNYGASTPRSILIRGRPANGKDLIEVSCITSQCSFFVGHSAHLIRSGLKPGRVGDHVLVLRAFGLQATSE